MNLRGKLRCRIAADEQREYSHRAHSVPEGFRGVSAIGVGAEESAAGVISGSRLVSPVKWMGDAKGSDFPAWLMALRRLEVPDRIGAVIRCPVTFSSGLEDREDLIADRFAALCVAVGL